MTEAEIINEIKNIFKYELDNNITLIYNKSLLKLKNTNIECYNYIINEFTKNKELWNNSAFKYLLHILYNIELTHCKICNKLINFDKTRSGQIYCSYKCLNNDKELNKQKHEHAKETCLKEYGCENPNQAECVKLKKAETCKKKYGFSCALQSPEIIKKREATCVKKYGKKSVLAVPEIREKAKEYFMTNYGVEYATQVPEIREKQKQTLLNNIGYDNPFKSPEIREKAKQSLINHFGTDCSLNVPEVREKAKQTILKNYNVENILQSDYIRNCNRINSFNKFWNVINSWKDYIIPLFEKDNFKGTKNNIYKWKCVKCGNEFETHIHTTRHLAKTGPLSICPRCINCYPFIENISVSNTELELRQFCQKYFSNLQYNIRNIIKPYELDIYIPELKLALQFNGDYYHSIEAGTPLGYHLMKTKMCEEQRNQINSYLGIYVVY